MTKPVERTSRKATVWTRERIYQLIALYKKHECLWNHQNVTYKSKERRDKAIGNICSTLQITKFDYGKKIHNLRNQFNSEMKKLEKRVEVAGTNLGDINAGQRCRWEHFESLMFLRNVIEPRPGYQSIPNVPQPKKMRFNYDYNSEDDTSHYIAQSDDASAVTEPAGEVTEYHFEAAANEDEVHTKQVGEDDFHYVEEEVPEARKAECYDQKYTPPPSRTTAASRELTITSLPTHTSSANKTFFTRVHNVVQKQQQQRHEVIHIDDTHQSQPLSAGSVIELTTNSTINSSPIDHSTHMPLPERRRLQSDNISSLAVRDQWDAFGELIASEFRHLVSDVSRKKLKRKIMQAMLEVEEEDDNLTINKIRS